jgi:hypothetical protein
LHGQALLGLALLRLQAVKIIGGLLRMAIRSNGKARGLLAGQKSELEREGAHLFMREALPLALSGIFEGKMMSGEVPLKMPLRITSVSPSRSI